MSKRDERGREGGRGKTFSKKRTRNLESIFPNEKRDSVNQETGFSKFGKVGNDYKNGKLRKREIKKSFWIGQGRGVSQLEEHPVSLDCSSSNPSLHSLDDRPSVRSCPLPSSCSSSLFEHACHLFSSWGGAAL